MNVDHVIPDFRRAHYIRERVALSFGVSSLALLGERRSRAVARPRQVAMYLCSELLKASLPQIGRVFGGRDHTTVMHAIKTVRALMATDPGFRVVVERLRTALVAELGAELPDLTQAIETAADATRRDVARRLYDLANDESKLEKLHAWLMSVTGAALIVALVGAPAHAADEVRKGACFSNHEALVSLFASTGHSYVFVGRSKFFARRVEIMRNEAGGFVVIERRHDGAACVVDAGDVSERPDPPPTPPVRKKERGS